jgi:hypothetical protein
MQPSDKPTSEMSLGRTLIFAIRLYQRGFTSFFSSTLILSAIMFGLLTIVLMYTVNIVEGNPSYYYSAMGMISQFFMIGSYLLALSLLYLAGASLLVGYNIRVGDDIVNGKAPENQRSLQDSRSGYIRTLWLFLTLFFGITVGFWLLWIPGVLAAILLPMAIPSHCIEGTDVLTSILRGYRLVRGRWTKTLLLLILATFFARARPGIKPGNYKIQVDKPQFNTGTQTISIKEGQTQKITINLDTGSVLATIRVTVKDKDSKPVSDAIIESTTNPSGQATLRGTSGADGSTTFDGVMLGSYTLQASKSGYTTSTTQGTASADKLNEFTITLPNQPTGGGGIPGFPYEATIIGILIAAIYLLISRAEQPQILTETRIQSHPQLKTSLPLALLPKLAILTVISFKRAE